MGSSAPLVSRILLIGMMGSGKTTVGRLVAQRLGWRYLDSDEEVERTTGKTVRAIFESEGEAAFRAEEKRALVEALASDDRVVVSVAGGAVLDPENRRALSGAGTVVWLRAPVEVLAARVGAVFDHRPLLGDDAEAALRRLDGERRPLYAALADITIDTEDGEPDELAARIVDEVRR